MVDAAVNTASVVHTIYSTSNKSISEFKHQLASHVNGVLQLSTIETSSYDISVRKNVDYDDKRQKEFPDGFLFFKFLIEFDFKELSPNESLEVISDILNWLWNNKIPAVASVDVPNGLPNQGGYNVLDVPWPY